MRLSPVTPCLLFLVVTASGQTDRSILTGTVADPNGALVADAEVEVRNVDSGAIFEGGTSSAGNYIVSLPAGNYKLTVIKAGFKTFVREGLEIAVAAAVRQDVTLEVGPVSESITVTGETPLLQTEGGELSHHVDYARVNRLPVLTLGLPGPGFGSIRNPLQALNLLPGTDFSDNTVVRVNGLPANTQAVRIEGQDATNGIFRQLNEMTQGSVDAIEEVSLQTSNYAAEFGQAGGGYFNYTMKSGTNQLHGGAYDYFVNEALHAGTPYTDDGSGHHIRNRQRRNDYGFTLGGPVVLPGLYDGHDRSFFFFSFEQFGESQITRNGVATVATADFRQGDFGQALTGRDLRTFTGPLVDPLGRPVPENGVYDPMTQVTTASGSVVRDLFPNNVVPMSRFDPVAAGIQAYLPEPRGANAAALTSNYQVPAYENYRHVNIPPVKVDHSVSPSIKLSGYYSLTRTVNPQNNGFPEPIRETVPQDDRSQTMRLNYDQTVTPTVLLHLGAGLLTTRNPQLAPEFDQSTLGLVGYYADAFPGIKGIGDLSRGGYAHPIGPGLTANLVLREYKPTANASLTWVKSNHTIKAGGEMVIEGFPLHSKASAGGSYGFSPVETAIPWQGTQFGFAGTSGYSYASFLLGRADLLTLAPPSDSRLGNRSLGLFVQDTWKATRKLTLAFGLRWDYITYLREQYGRMANAAFHTPNPTVGGRNGAVIYEGSGPDRCQCSFSSNYPWAFGPRLSGAYQIDSRTVVRAGFGISYAAGPSNAYVSLNTTDLYTFNAPAYGDPAAVLQDGNPYREGNPFGNGVIRWPNFDTGKYPVRTQVGLLPQSPPVAFDRHTARPPRITQWSIGVQREVARGLVVEATYLGNRAVWWAAPALADMYYNALQPGLLQSQYGIDIHSAADQLLLLSPLQSPIAAQRGFSALPYDGFPRTLPVNQSLRPYPQWFGLSPSLGPPLGMTWYDALQVNVTKRYAHGLDLQAAFTWQKELANGLNSDGSSIASPSPPLINDVFNRGINKQWSSLSRPIQLVLSFTYTTPGFAGATTAMKALSWAVRDWRLGGVLRYQSGALIRVPGSNNGVKFQLKQGDGAVGVFGTATFYNRVPGQPLFAAGFDPNVKFDPTRQLALNADAWVDAAPGTFSSSAAYYGNYRWQRQPSEALNFGRVFRMGTEGRYQLQVRAEFQNVFNRMFYAMPSVGGSPFQPGSPGSPPGYDLAGRLSSGFGFVAWAGGGGARPRTGQLVARFTF